jgi:hypothetical protein
MTKKFAATLVLVAFAVGGVFAQSDEQTDAEMDIQTEVQIEIQIDEQADAQVAEDAEASSPNQAAPYDFSTRPKNTITVDLGPTIIGAAIGIAGNLLPDELDTSGSFGIGVQYERQLMRKLSVAARFSYLGAGLDFSSIEDGDSYGASADSLQTDLGVRFTSFSLEGHARFYPRSETFFLDGMLGYANFKTAFTGNVVGENSGGKDETYKVSFDASRNYFLLGAKLGWRITFGKRARGGFVFEPALGYYAGLSSSDKFGTQLSKGIRHELDDAGGDIDDTELDDIVDPLNLAFSLLENIIFVGGPRVTLSFGWRF